MIGFLINDALNFSSHRFSALFAIFSALFGAIMYGLFGTNATMQAVMVEYGMSFATYLVIGTAFSGYIGQAVSGLRNAMSPWLLEDIIVTPTKFSTFIVGSSIWPLVFNLWVVVAYLAVGSTLFGIHFLIDIPATLCIVCLGVSTMVAIGMFSSTVFLSIDPAIQRRYLELSLRGPRMQCRLTVSSKYS